MNKKHEREDILETGSIVMREKGYHNTGVNDILVAAGIPKGSFYNFFENKEEFAAQVLVYYGQIMLEHIKRYTRNKSLTPLERLRQFYQFTIDVNGQEDYRKGCLINNFGVELGGLSEYLAAIADQQFNRLVSELSGCIQEGQEQGAITKAYTAEELAQFIHTSFFGSLTRSKMTRSAHPMASNLEMLFSFLTST